jgi:hypothetical protein
LREIRRADGASLLLVADRLHAFDENHDDALTRAPVAVLIENGRVAAIGPAESLRSRTRVPILELPGATLTPGLTDSHIHLTEWALTRREVDLSRAASPLAAARAVADFAASQDGEWVRGRGWNLHLWNGEQPDREILDRLLPDRPVALQSHDMHGLWVNSAALERAGITADTADPPSGRIVRDAQNRPTGWLLEAAGELVTRAMRAFGTAETIDAVLHAQSELHAWGITAVHALPAIHIPEPEPLAILEAVRDSGRLRLRILQHLPLRMLDEAIRLGLKSGFGGDWIRIGGVKMFLDGTLGSRTAWMRAPYENSTDCGVQVLEAGEFGFHAKRAAAAGIASTVHAIGDAAVALALDVLADPTIAVPALRHRIEHVQCCPEDRMADPGRAGVICSMQPAHLITDWRIADHYWGTNRARCTYAFRPLLRGGAVLAFGSDAPVEPADPRIGLWAAIRRADLAGQPPDGWFPEHRLNAREALFAYTRGPALAAGQPARGRIGAGAPADIVAWQADPLEADAAAILGLRCIATIVAGEVVYS